MPGEGQSDHVEGEDLYAPSPALSLLRGSSGEALVADEPQRALKAKGCGRPLSAEQSGRTRGPAGWGLCRGGAFGRDPKGWQDSGEAPSSVPPRRGWPPRLLRRELWGTAEAPLLPPGACWTPPTTLKQRAWRSRSPACICQNPCRSSAQAVFVYSAIRYLPKLSV